jgi:selenide,water dikinase
MTQLNKVGCEAAQAVGAKAATDITGFGLAGHAGELAQSSGVTVIIDVGRLPILPGAEELARRGNQTRASASNRAFAEQCTRVEAGIDPLRLEFVYDAQTSGGLLIAAPRDRAGELVERARAGGAAAACIIGEVVERRDAAVILRA